MAKKKPVPQSVKEGIDNLEVTDFLQKKGATPTPTTPPSPEAPVKPTIRKLRINPKTHNAYTLGANIMAIKGVDEHGKHIHWNGSTPRITMGADSLVYFDGESNNPISRDKPNPSLDGFRAGVVNLLTKFLRKPEQSVEDIVRVWVGKNKKINPESNVKGYIETVSQHLGIPKTQKIDWTNKDVLSNLIDGIVHHEQQTAKYSFTDIERWYPHYEKDKEEAIRLAVQHHLAGKKEWQKKGKNGLSKLLHAPATTGMAGPLDVLFGSFEFPVPLPFLMAFANTTSNGLHESKSNAPADFKLWAKTFFPQMPPELREEMSDVLYKELRMSGYTKEHFVGDHDTYNSIAAEYGISANELRAINGFPTPQHADDNEAELPERPGEGKDYTVTVRQPTFQGIFSSLDGVKDFTEAADAFLNGWIKDDGLIDWDLADLYHPETQVADWIKKSDPQRFDTEDHSMIESGDNPFLAQPVESQWFES